MTHVPAPTFGPRGFVAPSQADILAGVQADINEAFGGALNFSNQETPQGQLATSLSAIIGNAYDLFVAITNQVDPAFAAGRMQDAIARIYFLTRNPARATVVQAVCSGLPDTPIPEGALAKATDGNIYVCTTGGVIASTGTATLPFSCEQEGPVACAAGALNRIYQAIPGWDSITNPDDGVIGVDVESRAAFETRRQASVAQNSAGALASIKGAVLSVEGVIDAYVTENTTNSVLVITGFGLVAHSVYVAVSGGDDNDIARAIWTKKAPGCAYNGNTSVVVQDTSPGYSPPYPSYTVLFVRPTRLSLLFSVSILNGPQVPANAAQLIQDAVVSAVSGGDGGPRAGIGSTILATRFYAPIIALGPWVQLLSIGIGSKNNAAVAIFAARISGTTLTVSQVIAGTIAIGQGVVDDTDDVAPGTAITAGSGVSWTVSITQTVAGANFTGTGSGTNLTASAVTGTILPGMVITGTGVPANTTIASQTSGTTGGAGVYVTSNATTSSGAAIVADHLMFGALANLTSVVVGIAQTPDIEAANVKVSLV